MNLQTLTACTLGLVFNCSTLLAQLEKLRFEHITVNQGLSDNNALSAMKDAKGYMWFSTWNGLNKYDGYTVTNYFADPYDSASLSYNTIFSIYGDNNGKLWFTVVGAPLTTYDLHTETFQRFIPDRAKGRAIHLGATRAVIQDTAGIVWLGNNNGELGRFDPRTNTFLSWNSADSTYLLNNMQHVTVPNVDNFYKDRSGSIWIGTYNGLYHHVSSGKQGEAIFEGYHHDSNNVNSLSHNRVTRIYESRDGTFWLGTADGLDRWDRRSNRFTVYKHDDNDPTTISSNFITGIAEDKNGNMWIATRNGLNTFNPKSSKPSFIRFMHDPDEPTSLGNNAIFSMYLDSSDVLWLPTLGGGVSKLDLNQKQIQVYRNKRLDANSISDNKVTAIVEDTSGIVWIGTAYGGVNAWNRKTNQFTRYTYDSLNPKSIAGNQVGAILLDNDGDLWIGTGKNNATAALSKFNRNTSTFDNYIFNFPYAGPPSGNVLLALYHARNGTIWIGTSHGYIQFDKKTGHSVHVPYDPTNLNGITDFWVNCFYEDKHGNMWMGPNSNALNKLDTKTGIVSHYQHNSADSTSIASSIVKCMFRDSKGRAWFGTRGGGLSLLHEDSNTFTNFTTRDGLPSNTVFSITEDNENNLWLSTNKGICMFNYALNTAITYTTADGLPGNHFESEVGSGVPSFKGKDGTLYFGGPNGLIVFDPKNLKHLTPPGEVVITQFKVFDKPVRAAAGDTIMLNYNENFISFQFASLNYVNPYQNNYTYMLEGLDKHWTTPSSGRVGTYTNLAPGTYIFRVRSSGDKVHWTTMTKPVVLIIHPPWWRTWWFYTAIALLTVTAVYALFQYRLNQKIKIFQIRNRLHRDLHDDVGATLSSVKAYSEILKDNPDKPLIADLIIENANDMIVSLEDISWATNPQFDNLGSLVSKIKKFAVPLLWAKKIEFHLTSSGLDDSFQLPGEVRRNILLIVKEALNNISKYSRASRCSLSFSLTHRTFLMVVTDDGVGLNGSVQGAGNGIRNMRNRTSELNGKMDVVSGNGTGSSLYFSIHYPFTFTPLSDLHHKQSNI